MSSYIKGDSLIVMAINATKTSHDIQLTLPYKVKSGVHLISTGNETDKLCQESPIEIDQPTNEQTVPLTAYSLNTYIFMLDQGSSAIKEVKLTESDGPKTYYDLMGRRMDTPHGLCIEKNADGSSVKVYIKE